MILISPDLPFCSASVLLGIQSGSLLGSCPDLQSKDLATSGKTVAAWKRRAQVDEVLDYYALRHPRARPGALERKRVLGRLREGYSVRDLKQAIDGCHLSAYHNGVNEGGQRYQSLRLIFRSSDNTARFIELAEQAALKDAGGSEKQRRARATLSEWIGEK